MKKAKATAPAPENTENAGKAPGESPPAEPGLLNVSWTWRKMFFIVVLALIIHVGLIGFFGTKKQIVPREVSKVPHLQLASDADEFIALANPTLFALPNPRDFASVIWLRVPAVTPPSFRWTEPPQWLPLDTKNPDLAFPQFMPTKAAPEIQLDVKPPPEVSAQSPALGSALPQSSTLKILGDLAHRVRPDPVALPSLPDNNVIPPSKIQVLVDTTGNVISAILLPLTDGVEAEDQYAPADQKALQIARGLHFTPAKRLMFGEIILNWHTVPVFLNNTPANP
jgi:hypothetical protein